MSDDAARIRQLEQLLDTALKAPPNYTGLDADQLQAAHATATLLDALPAVLSSIRQLEQERDAALRDRDEALAGNRGAATCGLHRFCDVDAYERAVKAGKGPSGECPWCALGRALRARDAALAWDDAPLPEDDAIKAAHPTRIGRHETYAEATRLVGACRSKGKLVALVNWLLNERDEALTNGSESGLALDRHRRELVAMRSERDAAINLLAARNVELGAAVAACAIKDEALREWKVLAAFIARSRMFRGAPDVSEQSLSKAIQLGERALATDAAARLLEERRLLRAVVTEWDDGEGTSMSMRRAREELRRFDEETKR